MFTGKNQNWVKNLIFLSSLILFISFVFSCSDPTGLDESIKAQNAELKSVTTGLLTNQVSDVASVVLFAGQTTTVGSVVMRETDTNSDGINDALSVTYSLTGGWLLSELHLWIGSSLTTMPQTKTGNPQIGQFPYSPTDVKGKSSYTVTVPFSSLNYTTCSASYFAAAHASVYNGTRSETAWGAGTQMNLKGSWATYFNVNLVDNNPPVITGALPEVTVEGCSAESAPVTLKSVSELESAGLKIADTRTTDDKLVVSSKDVASGSCPVVVTRTYTITDACGNSSTISQKINVEDTTAPEVTGSISTSTIEGCISSIPLAVKTLAELKALGVTVTDGCTSNDNLTVSSSDKVEGTCPVVVTRTYTVTDMCGNATTIKQIINITDVTAPVLFGQGASMTINSTDTPQFTAPGVSDNCDQNPTVTYNDQTVTNSNSTVITRTWSSVDACGNVSQPVSQTITINNPVVVDPGTVSGTGWAYGGNYAHPFTSYSISAERWGWTNGALAHGSYTFDLYVGAGRNDLSKGTNVGTVTVNYSGSSATVTFNVNAPYKMTSASVYVGTAPLPTFKGSYTVAPGQLGNLYSGDFTSHSFTVNNLSGSVYVAGHADVE